MNAACAAAMAALALAPCTSGRTRKVRPARPRAEEVGFQYTYIHIYTKFANTYLCLAHTLSHFVYICLDNSLSTFAFACVAICRVQDDAAGVRQ